MKKLLFLALLMTAFCQGQQNSATPFETNFNLLLENLSGENWTKAEQLSKELLAIAEPVDSMDIEKKVLRYMYLYSVAGLLNEKKFSKEAALEKVMFLKSKEMIMPSHPFRSNCYINCTQFSEGQPNTFVTGVNNASGTQIFSFEYVTIENGIKEKASELEGKFITLKGVLTEITVEGSMLPRFKLKFSNGDYIVENP